jgi:hypothetical protein
MRIQLKGWPLWGTSESFINLSTAPKQLDGLFARKTEKTVLREESAVVVTEQQSRL